MKKIIDVRSLQCPQPVLETKKALEVSAANEIEIITDSAAAKENIERFLRSKGLQPQFETKGDSIHITII
jgi:TusA-related sulfurtransferase